MEQIQDALTRAGLPAHYENKKIHRLSGGEKRRIALLRALLAEYDILLLDEPFTGLDEKTKEQLLAYTKASTGEKQRSSSPTVWKKPKPLAVNRFSTYKK